MFPCDYTLHILTVCVFTTVGSRAKFWLAKFIITPNGYAAVCYSVVYSLFIVAPKVWGNVWRDLNLYSNYYSVLCVLSSLQPSRWGGES